jgi:hypothetical protein
MTSPEVEAPDAYPLLTTHPLLGVAGVLVASMSTVPTQYRQVVPAPVEAK